jgi:hypothetical protein
MEVFIIFMISFRTYFRRTPRLGSYDVVLTQVPFYMYSFSILFFVDIIGFTSTTVTELNYKAYLLVRRLILRIPSEMMMMGDSTVSQS